MVALRRQPGVTLAETVVALLILVAGFMVAANIYNRSLQYSSATDRRARAALAAQEAMAQIRAEGRDFAAFRAGVPSFASRSGPHPQWGDLTLETRVEALTGADAITSPSRELESGFPGERVLPASVLKAQVRVTWTGSSPRGITMVSFLAEPPRPVDAATSIEIGPPPPSPVPAAGAPLTATLRDDGGTPIDDLTYRWYLIPGTTCGRIASSDRLGKNARIEPVYESLRGTLEPSPAGRCTVQVRAVYNGREHWGALEVQL